MSLVVGVLLFSSIMSSFPGGGVGGETTTPARSPQAEFFSRHTTQRVQACGSRRWVAMADLEDLPQAGGNARGRVHGRHAGGPDVVGPRVAPDDGDVPGARSA